MKKIIEKENKMKAEKCRKGLQKVETKQSLESGSFPTLRKRVEELLDSRDCSQVRKKSLRCVRYCRVRDKNVIFAY